ncbi:MAG: topoisomerase IV [Oscillospiraceae bacterium]|jgi:DNA gyrase subunit A|nr:topoisomerase IV [Oscillospiraceae bacterium]
MAKRTPKSIAKQKSSGYIEGAGQIVEQAIPDTLEVNYMPYAMSVIVSRALPEIDGFKPSHRKLLYTMYKMGLLTGARTKCANIVGQTMKLNPHGDTAIYETLVRLSRGNECLLHPFVDSKGNFGRAYSRDMAYAASRYTEAKLEPLCRELFEDIDKDTVDFVPNYDNQSTEPLLLPVRFPSILTNNNIGIAVSMASNICGFNLAEVCDTTVALMKDPQHDILSTLNGPDFPGGGFLLYDEAELRQVIDTGRGSLKIRAKYSYDKDNNVLEITEIPATTTVEAIIDKVVESVKLGKIREISDARDETDLSGLKLALDLKRGTDPDALMKKLFRLTPLSDTFSCNFNILVAGTPRVMGVREILTEWTAFRSECVRRGVFRELAKIKEKLHLLLGLKKILLDIDKAVKTIRETEEESEVVPNLMVAFGIDELQAEYVAEIKLRHINREYILKRTEEIGDLKAKISDLEETLESPRKLKAIIIAQLNDIKAKYGQPRKTLLLYDKEQDEAEPEDETPDYPVNIFVTAEGYFKKITPQSLRVSGEQKLKDSDTLVLSAEANNRDELIFFTDKGQAYKSRVSEFDDTKASVLGEYVPQKLAFDEGEKLVATIITSDYTESIISFFKNGKCAKVPLSSFETKTKRKKLQNSLNTDSPLVAMFKTTSDRLFSLLSSVDKALTISTALILPKDKRDTAGVQVMTFTRGAYLSEVQFAENASFDAAKFTEKTIPKAGKPLDLRGRLE